MICPPYSSFLRNYTHVDNLLAKCGLNLNRSLILNDGKGLWVVQEDDPTTYDEGNLLENRFIKVLAWLAFTSYGSSGVLHIVR